MSFIKKCNLPLVILGLSLALLTTWNFNRPSEEQKIQRILQEMGRAVERKDLLKILSYVAVEYEDDMGFDRYSLSRVGANIFKTYQKLFVHLQDIAVEVEEDQAQARLVALFLAARQGDDVKEDLLIERGSDRFIVTFRKMDHAWKIIRTEVPQTFD